jgi:hypothetical protein
MKKQLFLMIIVAAMAWTISPLHARNTPRYAASTRTWVFDGQTWSDAIRIPACDKTGFTDSYTDPQCRSYTLNDNTWYYYNWPYVNENKDTLCPSPWRVPTRPDVTHLAFGTSGNTLVMAWGLAGSVNERSVDNVGHCGLFWSSSETPGEPQYALSLNYSSDNQCYYLPDKYQGFQVRCVR